MTFANTYVKRLRKDSAPDAAFKANLRSRLVGAPVIAHAFPSPMLRYAMATATLVVVLFFSTSTFAYASSSVAEGDLLYPVKANLEHFEGSLKRTPEAKARFRIRMLDRRIRETTYRLRHNEPLTPADVRLLSNALSMSVDELKTLRHDEAGRVLAKTELKLTLQTSLIEFRTRIELSDLPDEDKDKYFEMIDVRLEAIDAIPTTP